MAALLATVVAYAGGLFGVVGRKAGTSPSLLGAREDLNRAPGLRRALIRVM